MELFLINRCPNTLKQCCWRSKDTSSLSQNLLMNWFILVKTLFFKNTRNNRMWSCGGTLILVISFPYAALQCALVLSYYPEIRRRMLNKYHLSTTVLHVEYVISIMVHPNFTLKSVWFRIMKIINTVLFHQTKKELNLQIEKDNFIKYIINLSQVS